ncbi:MAG: hypothetical protein L3K15_03095 [Thermoplasmata archaeon]|nr:hypothetical protein [Thermoplasmata archaeon]
MQPERSTGPSPDAAGGAGSPSTTPVPPNASRPAGPTNLASRFFGFLRRHPIALLFLLTPGIPEYLSGSSPMSGLLLAPPVFFLFLAANAGLYTTGVLLIREAVVRWKKSWLTVFVLGLAYGVLEEGIALSTLFNPGASVVGVLGSFGHWMGVSWVWASGVLLVHVVFSVAAPILLLGLALPATRGRPLVGRRGLVAAGGILGADVLALLSLTVFGLHFWMGWPLLIAAVGVIGILVMLALRIPQDAGGPVPRRMAPRARTAALVGASLFPAALLTQAIGGAAGIGAVGVVAAMVVVESLYFAWVWTRLRSAENERALVAFALGLLAPLAIAGLLVGFPVEVAAVGVGLMVAFFVKLLRMYPDRRAPGPALLPRGLPSRT